MKEEERKEKERKERRKKERRQKERRKKERRKRERRKKERRKKNFRESFSAHNERRDSFFRKREVKRFLAKKSVLENIKTLCI